MTTGPHSPPGPAEHPPAGSAGLLLLAWLFVGLPLAWGVMQTLLKAMALFH